MGRSTADIGESGEGGIPPGDESLKPVMVNGPVADKATQEAIAGSDLERELEFVVIIANGSVIVVGCGNEDRFGSNWMVTEGGASSQRAFQNQPSWVNVPAALPSSANQA